MSCQLCLIKDVLKGIQPFLGVIDFYQSYFTTVSSIATRIGTALPYYMTNVCAQSLWAREQGSGIFFNVTRGPLEAVFHKVVTCP